MAHIDTDTGEVVLRVVYDGAPGAGKTTSLRALHASLLSGREGVVHTPDDGLATRDTVYFDWRDFRGGYLEGHPLRCQVLTVPGQLARRERRARVLDEADAVVFVADADPEALASAREALDWLRAHRPSLPFVVQLNKTDLDRRADEAMVRAALALPVEAAVVEAAATEGRGVSAAFLAAVRYASEHARASGIASLPRRAASSVELLVQAMRRERDDLPRRAASAEWIAMWPMAVLLDEDLRALFLAAAPARDAKGWESAHWLLETGDGDVHRTEEEAKRQLGARVAIAPRGRAFVLGREQDDVLRLWTLTPRS